MLVSKYPSEALNVAFWHDLQLSAKQIWLRSSDTSPVLSESKAEASTYSLLPRERDKADNLSGILYKAQHKGNLWHHCKVICIPNDSTGNSQSATAASDPARAKENRRKEK